MQSLSRPAQFYLYTIYVCGLLSVGAALLAPPTPTNAQDWELVLYLLLALFVGGKRIDLHLGKDKNSLSISLIFLATFASLLRFGPAGAVMTGAAGSLSACLYPKRQPIHQLLFNVSLSAVEGWIAGALFVTINGHTLQLTPVLSFLAVMISSLTFYLINSTCISLILNLCTNRAMVEMWKSDFIWIAPSYFAGACLSTLAIFIGGSNAGVDLLFAAPAGYLAYQSYASHIAREDEKQNHINELEKGQKTLSDLYLATIKSLALAIDAKDQYTHQHILRVQRYAMAVAHSIGLEGDELEGLNTGALLHDIGKLGIPEHVLLKPGRLTEDEFDKIKKHPEIGAAILDPVVFPWPVLPVVKYHHEKWDGTGYPSGLKGEDIPLSARILAVADVYDALTSTRPYRKAWSHERAIALIRSDSGTHFDPAIADAFLAVIDEVQAEIEAQASSGSTSSEPDPAITRKSQFAVHEIHRASSEIWALYEISQSLSASLGLAATLEIMAGKLEQIFPGGACLFLLKSKDTHTLTVQAAAGLNREHLIGARTLDNRSCTVRVAQGAPTYFGEYEPDDLLFDNAPAHEWTPLSTVLCTAITYEGETIGTINLYHPVAGKLTANDIGLLETIAERLAPAIHNARLFDETTSQALTDPLTGLWNFRHLTTVVDSICERSAKAKERGFRSKTDPAPFALLCLDLDLFKPINDNFGHHKGDEALKGIASLLRMMVREDDVVARYGGDEFIIALRSAGPEQAEAMAARIQVAVESYDLGLVHERLGALRLAVSVGWACYPQDGQDCASLMSAADSAMYRDKTERKLGQLTELSRSAPETQKMPWAA